MVLAVLSPAAAGRVAVVGVLAVLFVAIAVLRVRAARARSAAVRSELARRATLARAHASRGRMTDMELDAIADSVLSLRRRPPRSFSVPPSHLRLAEPDDN